ncbi:AAA family ATPase [Cellulomonas sp. 73-92]|uniref:McrB family protein n=1 Tax=Cellulomonas sp. 73-92 TaxID=1895740 RepID=UPI000AFF7327|nr:AAA family ATPase [Cellulomonas sp. 73-92]
MSSDAPTAGHRAYLPIPGTERLFGGAEYQLADSPAGYVYKRDSHLMHAADCLHEPRVGVEPRTRDEVIEAWRQAPDEPVDPRWCPNCLRLPVNPIPSVQPRRRQEEVAAVAAAARVVLAHLLGDGLSTLDPSRRIWTAENATALRNAIFGEGDTGKGAWWDRFRSQLTGAPRDVLLLAAEAVYLRSIPVADLRPDTRRQYVEMVLTLMQEPVSIPAPISEGLTSHGVFNGGRGWHGAAWQQIVWLCDFTVTWNGLTGAERESARRDPWAFRDVAGRVEYYLPMMRNAFVFMAFPDVFENIVNDDHKRRIRDAFAHVIGAPSGTSLESVDRDLFAIRSRLESDPVGNESVDWYTDPWYASWNPPKDAGDRAWAVRTKPAGIELIERWRNEGFVSLAASHLAPLTAGAPRETVRVSVDAGYEHVDYAQRLYLTDDYFAFLSRMQVDDVVVARHDEQAWLGRITGDPEFCPDEPRLRRSVDWLPDPIAVATLPLPVLGLLGATSRTVIDLTEGRGALEKLFPVSTVTTLQSTPEPVVLPTSSTPPLKGATSEFAASLHLDRQWLDDFIGVLESRQQVIVYGPPGTGKTYLARKVARYVASDDAVRLVQFHPSYAYEDFFEGFRPRVQGETGLAFELQPGPLRRIASAASLDPGVPYVLIIDEINRSNIAKVFGELYFLLEYRDEYVGLQYSPEAEFRLPKNLFIIGTMNTADRSIALVDAAIRRRFSFIEMHPDSEPVASLLDNWLAANHRDGGRADLLRALNAQIGTDDRDFQIGPSYLMRDDADTEQGLERIWDYDILPLLEEHYYGRLDRAQVRERFGLARLRSRLTTTMVVETRGAGPVQNALPGGEGDVDLP